MKMKYCKIIIVAILSMALLCGCGVSFNISDPTQDKEEQNILPADSLKVPCPEIDSLTILDNEIISVSVNGLEYNSIYDIYVVKMVIQNHSDRTISYDLDYVDVNGYTFTAMLMGEIYGGMSADADFGFPVDEVLLSGIKRIQNITFTLNCEFKETNETICDYTSTLITSDNGSYTETYNFRGEEAYHTDDYSIIVKSSSDPTVVHPIVIYVENNTDTPIMVAYDNIALNDKMVFSVMSGPYVLPHSHRVEEIYMTYFGETPEIDNLSSFTSGFSIYRYRSDGSFSTADIIDVSPITVSLQ